MDREFDVAVIGSGSAGTAAALRLRAAGRSVAVIDDRPFGGTCALRGCDPKKVLVAAATALDEAARYAALGIFDHAPSLDWPTLMAFKRTFTDPVADRRLAEYRNAGIAAIAGQARFLSPERLAVGDDCIGAKHVVIATGASPTHVAPGDDLLLTSDSFLELDRLPASLLFVGGGYVAFEFAHIAARAGARVTILHDSAQPLHGFDGEAVRRLLDATREAGIDVQLEARVDAVERIENGIAARVHTKDGERRFEAESGVLAAGRAPLLDPLDLPTGGIEHTKRGVRVNRFLQSVTNPRVYAAGDAADGGGLPLTPVAGYEGETVAENIVHGNVRSPEFAGLVSIVYAIPPLATAGLTQAQARHAGMEVDVRSGDMSGWYSTRHSAGNTAWYTCVVERGRGTVVGATILGAQAPEQINVLSLAIREGLHVSRVGDVLFGYPTPSSDLAYVTGAA